MLDLLAEIDQRFDLTTTHVIVSVTIAGSLIWLMQCLTFHASSRSVYSWKVWMLRAALASLAAAEATRAAMPYVQDTKPRAADVLVGLCLLLVLFAWPQVAPPVKAKEKTPTTT